MLGLDRQMRNNRNSLISDLKVLHSFANIASLVSAVPIADKSSRCLPQLIIECVEQQFTTPGPSLSERVPLYTPQILQQSFRSELDSLLAEKKKKSVKIRKFTDCGVLSFHCLFKTRRASVFISCNSCAFQKELLEFSYFYSGSFLQLFFQKNTKKN